MPEWGLQDDIACEVMIMGDGSKGQIGDAGTGVNHCGQLDGRFPELFTAMFHWNCSHTMLPFHAWRRYGWITTMSSFLIQDTAVEVRILPLTRRRPSGPKVGPSRWLLPHSTPDWDLFPRPWKNQGAAYPG